MTGLLAKILLMASYRSKLDWKEKCKSSVKEKESLRNPQDKKSSWFAGMFWNSILESPQMSLLSGMPLHALSPPFLMLSDLLPGRFRLSYASQVKI